MPEKVSSTPYTEFEAIYQSSPDPWAYSWKKSVQTALSSRFYEQRKYIRTDWIIPRKRYENILEIGCSIGVFTKVLARKGEKVLGIDYSPTALNYARERCRNLPQVRLQQARVPDQFPDGRFDLITFSETAYYLSKDDFLATARRIMESLVPGGYLVMAHYRHRTDFPLPGDFAHDWLLQEPEAKAQLRHVKDWRRRAYRMDLWQKVEG